MFAQFIEPATILTVSIAAVYLIGWSYLGGYFQRVGFLPNSLELPTSHYLEQGSGTIITVWLIFGCVFIGASSNKLQLVFGFLPLILVLAWGIFLRLTSSEFRLDIVILAIVAGGLIPIIGPDRIIRWVPSAPQERIILAVFFYALLIYGARIAGAYTGKKAVEGRSYSPLRIVFTWREAAPPEIQKKDLLLILHNKGKYYVVEKENPKTEDPISATPETYIIPDDLIKYVSLTRVKLADEKQNQGQDCDSQ